MSFAASVCGQCCNSHSEFIAADNIRKIAANDQVQKLLRAIADGSHSAELRAQREHALALLYEPYGGL